MRGAEQACIAHSISLTEPDGSLKAEGGFGLSDIDLVVLNWSKNDRKASVSQDLSDCQCLMGIGCVETKEFCIAAPECLIESALQVNPRCDGEDSIRRDERFEGQASTKVTLKNF